MRVSSPLSNLLMVRPAVRSGTPAIRFAGLVDKDTVELSGQLNERLLTEKLRKLDAELRKEFEPGSSGWDVVDMVFVLETEARQAYDERKAKYDLDLQEYNYQKYKYDQHMTWSERRRYRKEHEGQPPKPPTSIGNYYSPQIRLSTLLEKGGFKNAQGVAEALQVLKSVGYLSDFYAPRRNPDRNKDVVVESTYAQVNSKTYDEMARMLRQRVREDDLSAPEPGASAPSDRRLL